MRSFLSSLDTPGGHIIVCFVLMILGAAFIKCHVPKGEDVIVGAVGVLYGSMRGRGGAPAPTP